LRFVDHPRHGLSLLTGWLPMTFEGVAAVVLLVVVVRRSARWWLLWLPVAVAVGACVAAVGLDPDG
jgi:predicted exporter